MKNYGFPLFVSIVVAMFSASPSFAQVDPLGDFNRHVFETWKGDYVRVGQYKVKGSPFFQGNSYNGTIVLNDNTQVKDKKILYNLYSQMVGADVNHELFELDMPVSSFTLRVPLGETFNSLLFKSGKIYYGQSKSAFYNVLAEGSKYSLLKQFKINLIPDPSNELEKDRKLFEQYYEYYIYLHKEKELKKIKLNKKDILKLLGNEDLVIAYLKETEVDFSKERNVSTLINFVNSN